MKTLLIQQIRSASGRTQDQHRTLEALGIKKLGRVVAQQDTPQIRGMIKKIEHLLRVTEVEEE